jgi:hypothetical protein
MYIATVAMLAAIFFFVKHQQDYGFASSLVCIYNLFIVKCLLDENREYTIR